MLDEERAHGSTLTVSGLITSVQRKITKRGDPWATITLEDLDGAIEVLLFPSAYTLASTLLVEDAIVRIKGQLSRDKDQPELRAQEVTAPDLTHGPTGPVVISLPSTRCTPPVVAQLRDVLGTHPGMTEVQLRLLTRSSTKVLRLDDNLRVTPEPGPLRRPQAAAGPGMPDRVRSVRHADLASRSSSAFLVAGAAAGVLWERLWDAAGRPDLRGPVVPRARRPGRLLRGHRPLRADRLPARTGPGRPRRAVARPRGGDRGHRARRGRPRRRRDVRRRHAPSAPPTRRRWPPAQPDYTPLPGDLGLTAPDRGRTPWHSTALVALPAGAMTGLVGMYLFGSRGLARRPRG